LIVFLEIRLFTLQTKIIITWIKKSHQRKKKTNLPCVCKEYIARNVIRMVLPKSKHLRKNYKSLPNKANYKQYSLHIIQLQMWEEMGPVNVRAIMDTFSEISYKHLKTLRLWKVKAEDEGIRSICNYIEKVQTIEYLDMLDNDITPLGC
jgi:hypothetical protein